MPVRNEAAYLERSLRAVLEQSYPPDLLEVLVVDGRSSDGTREIAEALAGETAHSVVVVDNPERIAATALNRGLEKARGEIVIRVDGHCEISRDYVANAVEHLRSGAGDGVGGLLETVAESPSAAAIAVAMSSRFGVGGSAFRTRKALARPTAVDTVAFPAYTREALGLAGAFDEELVRNQDDEYNFRLRRRGGRVMLVPDMPARYYSRATLRSLARQYFQYGYWKVRVIQKHPRQASPRQFAPAALVGSLGVLAVLAAAGSALGRWSFLLLLACYVLASLAATALARGVAGSTRLRLPLAFAVLHFAYGFGFLCGLVRFAGRWRDRGDRERGSTERGSTE